jgi:radical SAM superfamily enzyme YgiQ (UPF0313 family)
MKITFIEPPSLDRKPAVERVFGCTFSLYPIPNIFSLTSAALLEKSGFEVVYIDMATEKWGRKRFEDFLKKDSSEVYLLHSVNLSISNDLQAHGLLRSLRKDVFILFAGPAPTYSPKDFLKDEKTIVVRGEPEVTLLELMTYLNAGGNDLSKIAGISFLKGREIIDNPSRALIENLDSLPFPARHLLRRNLYYNPKLKGMPFTAMQTSRNCSYSCIFCVPNSGNFARELEYRRYNQNKKPPVRMRSASSVVSEFALLKGQGYRAVSIIDDQFLWDNQRTREICSGIKDMDMEWGCLARADHITEENALLLAQAGCRYVDLGVESFDQSVLDDVRKNLKGEKIPEAVRILKKQKILVKINLILGISPLQTPEGIKQDIRMAKRLDVDAVMFSIATPFPGTEFYSRAISNKWLSGKGYRPESVQNRAIIDYPALSSRQLNLLVKQANLSFYFRPRIIIKNIGRIFNPFWLWRALVAMRRKFY